MPPEENAPAARFSLSPAVLPGALSRSPQSLLLACCLALGLAVAGSAVALLVHLRDRALDHATHEQQSMALVLADQADRAFDAIEQLQNALLERLAAAGVTTPDAFRRHFAGEAVHDELRGHIRSLPQLDALTVVDDQGRLINFSRYWPIPPVNVADRDYFQALSGETTLTSFIGEPVANRGTGSWTIYIARRVSNRDWAFLGLVLGAVELGYFERLYGQVTREADSAISLLRADGLMLARHPQGSRTIGWSFAQQPIFRALSAPGVAPGADRATVRQVGLNDQQARLTTAHRLMRYPMVVVISNTVEGLLSGWRQQAASLAGMALLIEAGIAWVAVLMRRRLRGQQMLSEALEARARAELERSDAQARLAVAHERERAAGEMALQHMRMGTALGNLSQALCMFDAEGRLVVGNGPLAAGLGLEREVIRSGLSERGLMARAWRRGAWPRPDLRRLLQRLAWLRAAGKSATYVAELSDGRAVSINFRPTDEQGWLATFEDITERRAADARIVHMAHHDGLTGLPNRVLFLSRLEQAVSRSLRGEGCAVLCLDLDHFKAVNDTLGHPAGDGLLRAVTARLLADVRETDTVARLGGDEFAIVQSQVETPEEVLALGERLIERLGAPYLIDGHQIVIGASIGIAMAPADGRDPVELLKHADLALYLAKTEGRGRYRCFEPEMDARMQARRALETDMREALRLGQFEIFYQPLLTLSDNKVSGFEALVRWRHPERGLVPPGDFIPLAEEIGLILPIGDWVLRRACHDAAGWPAAAKVAVNLSPAQFAKRNLVEDVADALADAGLAPERLELEITETVMLEDTEQTLAVLHRLRALGVRIAMDDFGTGYSSLSYLRRFPFDKVKIDRSFIQGLGESSGDSEAIVGAVTELCRTLGMATVAEGVETEAQLDSLRRGHCSEVQGYLFSRPQPASEVPAMLRRLNAASAAGGTQPARPDVADQVAQ